MRGSMVAFLSESLMEAVLAFSHTLLRLYLVEEFDESSHHLCPPFTIALTISSYTRVCA